jgi:hypothetical protein
MTSNEEGKRSRRATPAFHLGCQQEARSTVNSMTARR